VESRPEALQWTVVGFDRGETALRTIDTFRTPYPGP
jgi:hypothetical protein